MHSTNSIIRSKKLKLISYNAPIRCTIKEIEELSSSIKLVKINIPDDCILEHKIGQYIKVSIDDKTEIPMLIASSPTRLGYFELVAVKPGKNYKYSSIYYSRVGDKIGIHGPFGISMDMELLKNKNLLLVTTEYGIIPLRMIIQYCEDRREYFDDITILHKSSSWEDTIFKKDILLWKKKDLFDFNFALTLEGHKRDLFSEVNIGSINDLINTTNMDIKNIIAIVSCNISICHDVISSLLKKGISINNIILALTNCIQCEQNEFYTIHQVLWLRYLAENDYSIID
jgi:sulfhydrogenase subunit gamma (sulfur reductase)